MIFRLALYPKRADIIALLSKHCPVCGYYCDFRQLPLMSKIDILALTCLRNSDTVHF
jgi:hypothetical protein